MTKSEMAMTIKVMKTYYQNFYKDFTEARTIEMVNAWYEIFKEYDYGPILAALKTFISNDIKGFPPVPGQIIDNINRFQDATTDSLNGLSAWGLVSRALRNCNYNSESEYEKLPDLVKKCIKTPSVLREWAVLDTDELNTVISSNFQRSFRAEQGRAKQIEKIPKDILKILQGESKNLLGGN